MPPVGDSRGVQAPKSPSLMEGCDSLIWYFLAGFIGGAAGVIVFIHEWAKRHMVPVKMTKEEWEDFERKQDERSDD